jgi:phosphotransferase system enzyme I (PtsI)
VSPVSARLAGLAGSPGVAVGRAVVVGAFQPAVSRRMCAPSDAEAEFDRFRAAALVARSELRALAEAAPARSSAQSVLEAYALMVDDPMLADEVERRIVGEHECAEWAVARAIERIAGQLAGAKDAYLRERSRDVEFVGEHVLRAFAPSSTVEPLPDGPVVLVARDLSPADTARFFASTSPLGRADGGVSPPRSTVVALVTEGGTRTSHTSITARAHHLPAVVGVVDATSTIATGDVVVVDGLHGVVHVALGPDERAIWEERAARYRTLASDLAHATHHATTTLDGERVVVRANLELPEEAASAREIGAEGVGLFRTEYLYIDRTSPPDESAQLDAFGTVLDALVDQPVTLRTFDIGGDKFASSLTLPEELNPMLGLRAVRLAMSRPELFLEQLRAMVRAAARGPVRVMVPMIATVAELRWVRARLEEASDQVRAAGHPTPESLPLGVMIEVPGAALLADHFAREAAFMSIGTNDLIQYTLAVDRSSRRLAHLASSFDPAVLRLIDGVVRAGARHGCPVSVCGAMAAEPLPALLLLGLGVRDFSMAVFDIPEMREVFRRVSAAEARAVATVALELDDAAAIEERVRAAFAARLHDLLDAELDDPASIEGAS